MGINIKRFKNYGLWVAIFSLIPMVLNSMGIKIIPEDYEKITTTILTIFATLGILNNPTTECKWYRDEKGNKVINENIIEDDSGDENKVIKENINQDLINPYNEEIYELVVDLLKDKISNLSRIDNIEILLMQNLDKVINENIEDKLKNNNITLLKEDSSRIIQNNIKELLKENTESLVKDNLDKLISDNISDILKNNISNIIKDVADELAKNNLNELIIEKNKVI